MAEFTTKCCWNCGQNLDEKLYCEKCKADRSSRYLELRVREDKVSWVLQDWAKSKISGEAYNRYQHPYYFCHNCKVIMWHQLNYCPGCGGIFHGEHLTYREMAEKYSDYKTGY